MTTMKISDLIKHLKVIQNEIGDAEVYLSSDSEGNSYGTIDKSSLGIFTDDDGVTKLSALAIYPYNEDLDYDDIINK